MATNRMKWYPEISDYLPEEEDPNNLPAPPPIESLPGYIGSSLDPNALTNLPGFDPDWDAAQAAYNAAVGNATNTYNNAIGTADIEFPRAFEQLKTDYNTARRQGAEQMGVNNMAWSSPARVMQGNLNNQYVRSSGDLTESERKYRQDAGTLKANALGTAEAARTGAAGRHAKFEQEYLLKNPPPAINPPLAQGPTTTPGGQYITGSVGEISSPQAPAGQPSSQNVADNIAQSYWEGINNPFYSPEQQAAGKTQIAQLINSPMQAQLATNPLWDAIRQRLGL